MSFFNALKFIHSSTIAPTSSSKKKLPIVPKIDTTIRAKRLMKEFRELQKSQNERDEKMFSVNLMTRLNLHKQLIFLSFSLPQLFCLFSPLGNIQAELIDDNLFEWHVRLYHLDPESPLAQDMVELDVPSILLHLIFPDNFPFAPPFMRVVEPRIEKGFVMEGGAICMELLTPRGSYKKLWINWFPETDLRSLSSRLSLFLLD